MARVTVDLNCDVGELPGEFGRQSDAELMRYVSSANIACGGHAGDEGIIRQTISTAKSLGVSVGAHPGYSDRNGFGRTAVELSTREITTLVAEQITRLRRIAEIQSLQITHVKPHGALYNQAAISTDVAAAICDAILAVDRRLLLYGLSGSPWLIAGRKSGLTTVSEVFADRNYLPDGTLVPRTMPNALLVEPSLVARRVIEMVTGSFVVAVDGTRIPVLAETVCIHGDHPQAVAISAAVRTALENAGIEVVSPPALASREQG